MLNLEELPELPGATGSGLTDGGVGSGVAFGTVGAEGTTEGSCGTTTGSAGTSGKSSEGLKGTESIVFVFRQD